MPVQITRAGSADAARVADLAALTFPLACPPDSPASDIAAFIAANLTAARFAEYIADADRVVLLADDGTGLSGYAMLVFGEPGDPQVAAQLTRRPTVELSKIYVAPEHHGAGVAAALLAAAVEHAQQRRQAAIWLGTNQENLRAQRFYEKSGFARVGVKRFRLGDRWEDDYVFELALDPAPAPAPVYEAVLARRSYSKVTAQTPSTEEIERLLEAAATAADHAGLAPWRVIEVRGAARERLGDALAEAATAAGADAEAADSQRRKPLRAELLLAIVVSYRESPKAERWEQDAAAAGVAHLLTLLLDDAGWGAMWRTGPFTRTAPVARLHEVTADEALLGWIYVGGRPDGVRRERHATVDLAQRHTRMRIAGED